MSAGAETEEALRRRVARWPAQQHYGPEHPRREAVGQNGRRAPGRPRSETANQAIMLATLEMLGEGVSVDVLSVEAVAARASVGKATVYRRWPNKYVMVAAALSELREAPTQVTGGPVREVLVGVLRELLTWAAHSPSARALPHLLSGMRAAPIIGEEYHRVVLEPRMAALRAALRRGVHRGELRGDLDVELTVTVLAGAVMSRLMLPDGQPDGTSGIIPDPEATAARIVDLFLTGLEVGANAGPNGHRPAQ
ncbi:TetR/AcrR family transcriptional regulator [Micromonospora sp. NPDC049171]|uniref:TetR/AcrR family transcriptional regulator n=1 Tax=Micromonospora sp. NPDC049171 TaxID=3155770 RepID=UPI0033E935D9